MKSFILVGLLGSALLMAVGLSKILPIVDRDIGPTVLGVALAAALVMVKMLPAPSPKPEPKVIVTHVHYHK